MPSVCRPQSLSRRAVIGTAGVLGFAGAQIWDRASAAIASDWAAPPNIAAARAEAEDFVTYGMPDSWANYGEVFSRLADRYGFNLTHTDTDMNSLEEITKFDAEKNNPAAICADIGILFAALAEEKAVVPPYSPPNAARLPVGLKGRQGGWVATYTGVPAFVVNTAVIKTVPRRWSDLASPEYRGKISVIDAGSGSGTDVTSFIAWAYAFGGNENDLAPAVAFARTMQGQYASAQSNAQTLEKGEVPIQIKYDFNCIAAARAVQAKGVPADVVIPADGSIYAPSALMLNAYHTRKMNIAKLMLDFVLGDEGQTAFARFGARPIRWVLNDLPLPDDARANWLPDSDYDNVHIVADWSAIDVRKIARFWQNTVAG